jgi:site-specific recombinase XerC
LASVTLGDVDVFLDLKRAQGMKSNSVATNCQALRTFFRYAESIGRCRTGIARGIRSPAIPKFDGKPKGLPWTKVRQLIRSASGDNASDIRARAILLLCAVYGLRANEVEQTLMLFLRRVGDIALERVKTRQILEFLDGPRTSTVTWRSKHSLLRHFFFEHWSARDACRNC